MEEARTEETKLNRWPFQPLSVSALLAPLSLIGVVVAGGCGAFEQTFTGRTLFTTECDGAAERTAADLVILDWDGGISRLHPTEALEPLDLATFATADGGTLADDAEGFKEAVRRQINRIFCEFAGPGVRVHNAGETDLSGGTTVFLAGAVSPLARTLIGEGEFDPCNGQHDNVAVVFGEQIRLLADVYSLHEWVLVFANVTAHEIGHTLGYGHVLRRDHAPTQGALFVELMLDAHTMAELRREQRFLVEQDYCPGGLPALRRLPGDPTITCTIAADSAPPRASPGGAEPAP